MLPHALPQATAVDLDSRQNFLPLAIARTHGMDDERACAAIMDAASRAFYEEKQASLGNCFQAIRRRSNLPQPKRLSCGNLPAATHEWYSKTI